MLQDGEVIGAYQIEREIGQGGMATVYCARQTKLDRFVAIKVMHQNLLQDENFHARFNREARIVANLEHPHIVPIYDYDEHEGRPYLVMKYIDGMTLKRRAQKTGLSLDETIRIMDQVADALDYAHTKGVLHRDIKPSNILLDQDRRPYITDFGLARIAQAGESTISHDMMLGTPFYISPEQAQGEKNLTKHTDLYSFGVILYELITGYVPFSADTPYAIVHGHIYSQPDAPSSRNANLSDAVDAVIFRALAKKPAERYDSAQALMAEFAAALRGAAVPDSASPESMAEKIIIEPKETPRPAPRQQPQNTNDAPVISAPNRPDGQKRYEVERRFNMGNIDWGDISRRFGAGWEEIKSMIEERIDSEIVARELLDEGADPDDLDEREIRRRVAKKMKARQELITHAVVYVVINAMLFGIWLFLTRGTFPWPFIVIFAWGSGLAAQYVEYRGKYGAGAEHREKLVQRELARERARRGYSESQPRRYEARRRGRAAARLSKGQVAVPNAKAKKGKRRWAETTSQDASFEMVEAELRAVDDELERLTGDDQGERSLSDMIAPPKPRTEQPRVRLNEDGELTDSFVDEAEQQQRRR